MLIYQISCSLTLNPEIFTVDRMLFAPSSFRSQHASIWQCAITNWSEDQPTSRSKRGQLFPNWWLSHHQQLKHIWGLIRGAYTLKLSTLLPVVYCIGQEVTAELLCTLILVHILHAEPAHSRRCPTKGDPLMCNFSLLSERFSKKLHAVFAKYN